MQISTKCLRHDNRVSAVITKWLNPGSGTSFDRWSHHVDDMRGSKVCVNVRHCLCGPTIVLPTRETVVHNGLQNWAADFESLANVKYQELRKRYGPFVLRSLEEKMVRESAPWCGVRKAGSLVDVANEIENHGQALLVFNEAN